MIKSKGEKRLLSNYLSLTTLQIITYVLPLITLPYLVNVLGVEKYGLVMFAQSLVTFLGILVDYGFNLSATKDISVHRNDKDKVIEIFSSVITIKVLLLGATFFILLVIVESVDRFQEVKELYIISYLVVVGQAMFPVWYFQGLEKMKYITIINILSRVIFTFAIFLFVKDEDDYVLVPLINGCGVILGGVYSLYLINRKFKQSFKMQGIKTLKVYFKNSSDFFLSRVSVSVYTSSNVFVLGLFESNLMVGYYSIAEKLYLAIQGFYRPISQTLYPYIAKEKNIILYKKIFKWGILLNILSVFLLFFIGSEIFSTLFNQSIGAESINVFHIFLFANLITVPSIFLGYPFLAALGYARHVNKSVVVGSITHLVMLISCIYMGWVSIYNLAYMIVFTELVVLTYRVYWVKNKKIW